MTDHPDELVIESRFQSLANNLIRFFMKYQFTIVQKENVEKPLLFDADIPTLSRGKGKYLVWDDIFYWED